MPDEVTRATIQDAVTDRLRELGVQAPNHDTDAIASQVLDALKAHVETAEGDGAADGHASAPEATAGDEHADDAAGEATARDIASGKVVEPRDGGVVEPVDG